MTFSRVSKGSMLSVARSEGPALSFLGFKDKDVEVLRAATSKQIKEEAVATRQARAAGAGKQARQQPNRQDSRRPGSGSSRAAGKGRDGWMAHCAFPRPLTKVL